MKPTNNSAARPEKSRRRSGKDRNANPNTERSMKPNKTEHHPAALAYLMPNLADFEAAAAAEPLDTGSSLEDDYTIPSLDDFIFPVLVECPPAHIEPPDVSADDTLTDETPQRKR